MTCKIIIPQQSKQVKYRLLCLSVGRNLGLLKKKIEVGTAGNGGGHVKKQRKIIACWSHTAKKRNSLVIYLYTVVVYNLK
jgi:hypothetical protein